MIQISTLNVKKKGQIKPEKSRRKEIIKTRAESKKIKSREAREN